VESYPKIDALMLGALAFSSAILFAVLQEDIKPIFPNVTLALICVSITSGVSCQLFARHAFFKRIPRYRPFGYASFTCGLCVFLSTLFIVHPKSRIAAVAFVVSGAVWFIWLWREGGPQKISNKPVEPIKK
jgi:hypothetical protein